MEEIYNQRKYVRVTVDGIEGDKVLLFFDDGQKINWPKDELPSGIIEGKQLKLVAYTDEMEEREREEISKKLLNDILKID